MPVMNNTYNVLVLFNWPLSIIPTLGSSPLDVWRYCKPGILI